MSNETTRRNVMIGAGAAAVASTIGFTRPALAAADPSNLISLIATLDINEAKRDEAIEFLAAMAKAVEETEPGTLAYACHTVKDKPNKIIFFEIYDGPEGQKSHNPTKRAADAGLKNDGYITGIEITNLERIGGYIR